MNGNPLFQPPISGGTPWARLRQLAEARRAEEKCDFCSEALAAVHRHVMELSTRKIVCVCDACGLRFDNVVGRWKLVPRTARALPDFRMSDEQWDSLALPINLAFIFYNTQLAKMLALYPSPAGVTESLLSMSNWQNLVADNPPLATMQPDVEALLVNRVANDRDYFLAPIDRCYELSGLIRLHWRGLAGGDLVWKRIADFFTQLRSDANPVPQARREVVGA